MLNTPNPLEVLGERDLVAPIRIEELLQEAYEEAPQPRVRGVDLQGVTHDPFNAVL